MKKILIAVGVLGILNFLWQAIKSNLHFGYWLTAVLSIGAILYAVFFKKIPKKLNIAVVAVCSACAIFMAFLGFYGFRDNVDFTEDVVIVLGAGLRGDVPGSHLSRRLDTAVKYLRQNDKALVVVCGGLGAGRRVTEADAMARYLVEQGIPEERIIREDRSTSTFENLAFAKEILEVYFPEGFRAVVVSNRFHIFRAQSIARDMGMDVGSLGAPTPGHSLVVNYLREMFAVVYTWVFG